MPHRRYPRRTRHGITATVMPEIESVVHFHVGDQVVSRSHPQYHDLHRQYHAPDAPEDVRPPSENPPGPGGF